MLHKTKNTICNTEKSYQFKAYLGLTYLDNGTVVSITNFDDFIPVIADAFPEGFTLYDGTGGYQFEGKTFTEPNKILEIVITEKIFEESYRKFTKLLRQYSEQYRQFSEFYTVTETFSKFLLSTDPVDNCCKCKCMCKSKNRCC